MLALWLENRALRLRDDLPEPDPPPGEALVRVRLAGICGTDLELLAAGAIDPRPLIAARFPLRDAPAAFAQARRPGVLKVLLEVQPGA